MALVRCPIHNIPYNDANPRGCPACAREREGADPESAAIRELARASQLLRRPPEAAAPPEVPAAPRLSRVSPVPPTAPPVTRQPRRPVVEEGPLTRFLHRVNEHRILASAAIIIGAASLYLALTMGPSYVEGADPPIYTGDIYPLPVEPGQSVEIVFTILGARPPAPHPEVRTLARYAYGARLSVDGLNDVIYQITIGVPNWSWRGLRVSLPERQVMGQLALLGSAQTIVEPEALEPRVVSGYAVYPSLAARPLRTVAVEVRPPNGCFDVMVDLRPQAVGELVTRERRYAVLGRAGAPIEWSSTEVRVVHRAAGGPAGPAAC